ncbi:MAG: nuclear transport factor 2 family protein [Patescibacteria group bacterium]
MIWGYKHAVLIFALAAVVAAPSVARSADVDDLKATFEQEIAALNKRDLDAFSAFWHDQIVAFGPTSPFPTDGKAARRQGFQALFNNSESFTVTPLNNQYRVIGDTGIVWGHGMAVVKPKDGPLQTTFVRAVVTYTKVDGKWRAVAIHLSPIPSGN